VGTSISYRSPDVVRWRVFQQALAATADGQLPLERLRTEFFVAAAVEWKDALAAPAVAAYAGRLCDLWGTMAGKLRISETAERAIADQVDTARAAAVQAGFTPAAAIAERAFHVTLIKAVSQEGPVSSTPTDVAADSFETKRGAVPADLVQAYTAELVSQLARHVAARDSVALVGTEALPGRAARRLTLDLAGSASAVASGVEPAGESADAVRAAWGSTVERLFQRGGERGHA
jgi:hypothetical protein